MVYILTLFLTRKGGGQLLSRNDVAAADDPASKKFEDSIHLITKPPPISTPLISRIITMKLLMWWGCSILITRLFIYFWRGV